MSVSQIVMNSLMAGYGDMALAGVGVAMKIVMIKNYFQIIMCTVTKRQNARLIWNLVVSILLKEEHI